MNQFKRAKQIGSQTESITDLKTAGVVQPKEKSPKQNTEIPIKKEESPSIELDLHTENINKVTQPVASSSTQTVISEENTVLSKTEFTASKIENITDVIAAQSPKTETIPDTLPVTKSEIIPQSIVYTETSAIQPTNTQSQMAPQQQIAQPVMQPQYTEPPITYPTESVETKPAKSSKKNAPNMFIQKNESKSIRKSLVLRPSSVKIAENYCAQNGGSFNELIQILLDNFIEEYGL